MNIEICRKHLIGKSIAFSTFGTIDARYHGVIAKVAWGKVMGKSLKLIAKDGNFHSVDAFLLGDSIMHSVSFSEKDNGGPMVEEPIISGCIPLSRMVKEVIIREEEEMNKPPKPPSVRELIAEVGTFTGCKELMDKFIKDGLIHKEDRTLYVDFNLSSQPGCMCGFASEVEQIESVTRDLLKFFDADEIIFHSLHRNDITVVEVEPGHKGEIHSLPGAHEGDEWCGTYPVIKGLRMRWTNASMKEMVV